MPEITQKLGFDANSAIANLTALSGALNKGNEALARFQNTANRGTKQLKRVDTAVSKTKNKARELTVSWQTMVRVVQTQFIVRGIALLISKLEEGVQRAREFGIAIEEIQTISGRTVGSRQLAEQILEISDALGKPSQDLAEAYYQTLSNQVVEAGEALHFTAQAARLATVTVSETEDAVNALSSVMNSYNLEASEAEHVAGTLFKTIELGRLRLSEFADIIGRVTPLTAAMGVEWEEAAATLAVMTRQGVRVSVAITQLRAVMTKIIRPTEEMRDIFRSWGVEDGKQAVETFGGLVGVLRKLSEETGGSSEEMADLLRRVRTIVGALSIMTNDGEDVTEAMEKIRNATFEVSEQWDKFTQSDAKQLNDEVVRFENALTRLGTVSLPTLTSLMGVLNARLNDFRTGWLIVTGQMDAATQEALIFTNIQEQAQQRLDRANSKFIQDQKARYAGLTQAANLYYAEVGKQENILEDIRSDAMERANKQAASVGKDLLSIYQNATTGVEDFVRKSGDLIKDNAQRVAAVQQDIEDRALQARLDKTTNVLRKIRILQEAIYKQRADAQRAFSEVDASEASVERAVAENRIALRLAEQVKSLAEQTGHAGTLARANRTITEILRDQQGIYRQNTQAIRDAVPEAKKVADQFREGQRELEALFAQRKQLFESGDLAARSEEVQRNAQARLAEIENQIENVIAEAAKSDALLKALGIDADFSLLTENVTNALDRAHKDWSAEVKLAQAAFDREVIQLRTAIDPTGAKRQAAEALQIDLEGVGAVAGARQVDRATIAALKEQEDLERSIDQIREQTVQRLERAKYQIQEGVRAEVERASVLEAIKTIGQSQAEVQRLADERAKAAIVARGEEAFKLHILSMRNADAIERGVEITQRELATMERLIAVATAKGQITEAEAGHYSRAVEILTVLNEENARAAELTKQRIPQEELKVLQQVRAEAEAKRAASEADKNAAETTLRVQNEVANTLEAVRQNSVESANAQQQQTRAAAETVNTTAQIGPTALQQQQGIITLEDAWGRQTTILNEHVIPAEERIGPTAAAQVQQIDEVTAAWRRVEAAARAAGRASSIVTNPFAGQYHGGPMSRFFAAGGFVRGQDKILASLSKGETVINSKSSRRFFSELNAMNQNSQPVFREQGGPVTNVGDINVTVNGGDSSQQTLREIGHALRREIQRGNIKLN